MKKTGKPKTRKRTEGAIRAKRSDTKLMTLTDFAKVSAIEGLHMSRDMHDTLTGLERRGASARERRAVLTKKYGRAS